MVLGGFAATALVLAALGIYAVLSYTVTQRIPEIGIRMALGESSARVRRRVVSRTMLLAGAGVTIGAVASFMVSKLMGSMHFGIQPTDALTFVAMAAILLTVAAPGRFRACTACVEHGPASGTPFDMIAHGFRREGRACCALRC